MDLGFPPADGALLVARVEGYLCAVAGDAEVGVLDVDGDDLPGVGGADAQALAGDHDDAVAGDLALDLFPDAEDVGRGAIDQEAR